MRTDEEPVLVVVGDADLSTASQLHEEICTALTPRPSALRVELGNLDFCDLYGLDALNAAIRDAAALGVRLTLTGMSPQLAWLHSLFPAGPAPHTPDGHSSVLPLPTRVAGASRPQYLGGAACGRWGAPDGLLHAVPRSDTTRSSLCGARVQARTAVWNAATPTSCTDCNDTLAGPAARRRRW